MFRRFARPLVPPLLRLRSKASATHVVVGISGMTYYMSTLKIINADSNIQEDTQQSPTSRVSGPKYTLSGVKIDKPRQLPSPDDALGANATCYTPSAETGIARVDSAVVPSNFPSEDFLSSAICHLPTSTWSFFAVFDGHNGSFTSYFLSENLQTALIAALADLFWGSTARGAMPAPEEQEHTELGAESGPPPRPSAQAIDYTIKETFKKMDDEIVNKAVESAFSTSSKAAGVGHLAAAQAGSCALVSFYESDTRLLRVAVTGDSRAVLGRRRLSPSSSSGGDEEKSLPYEAHVLSVDQNAHNPAEVARIAALHPGETVVDKGRVLGWGVSRAFGDGPYKWARAIQDRLHQEYLGDRPPADVKTPPYFTAEPEITTTQVRPGDFLVMASDGLWDCLTNEEVVGLVGLWLGKNVPIREVASSPKVLTSSGNGAARPKHAVVARDDLPAQLKEDGTLMYRWWRATKRFLNVDNNVAVHLARNALGGADTDLTSALLRMLPPRSRRYRDDISVTVVFFD